MWNESLSFTQWRYDTRHPVSIQRTIGTSTFSPGRGDPALLAQQSDTNQTHHAAVKTSTAQLHIHPDMKIKGRQCLLGSVLLSFGSKSTFFFYAEERRTLMFPAAEILKMVTKVKKRGNHSSSTAHWMCVLFAFSLRKGDDAVKVHLHFSIFRKKNLFSPLN